MVGDLLFIPGLFIQERHMTQTPEDQELLLYGVVAIAAFLGISTRKTHHLKDCHGLPTFKIGGAVCARPSTLRAWVIQQEKNANG